MIHRIMGKCWILIFVDKGSRILYSIVNKNMYDCYIRAYADTNLW